MLLDHVVHFTESTPEKVVKELQKRHLNAVVGGSHENWGTYNALLYTRDSYIEFLTVEDEMKVHHSEHPLISHLKYDLSEGAGFGTICLRTNDIQALKGQLTSRGFKTSDIYQAQRRTASNTVRKWKMLFIDKKIGQQLPYPFFIEWEEGDQERYEALQKDGTIKETNMNLSIEACIFNVANPRFAAAAWGKCLDIRPSGPDENELQLPNSRLVFLKSDEKERLKKVHLTGQGETSDLNFEGGQYRLS